MAGVVLHLRAEIGHQLRQKAIRSGQTLEAYLEQLAEREAQDTNGITGGSPSSQPALSDEEFDRLLDELSEGPSLSHLPADFTRSDIYSDHD